MHQLAMAWVGDLPVPDADQESFPAGRRAAIVRAVERLFPAGGRADT